jgi:hypothetical protein
MSSRFDSNLSRRHVLLGGAATAGALLPVGSREAVHAATEQPRISVLLHDRRIIPDAALVVRLQARGARVVALGEDPVRQWRDESAAWLAERDARLMGIARWPDFLMLRGLAAESRRHVRFVSPVSTDGVLTWLIA